MLYNIGMLVVDQHIKQRKANKLVNIKPEELEQVYIFGLIVDAQPIDIDDKYYLRYRDSFIDNISYTILWCDMEEPINIYSAGHIKKFLYDLDVLEKQIEQQKILGEKC
jgi:hypothetical protein